MRKKNVIKNKHVWAMRKFMVSIATHHVILKIQSVPTKSIIFFVLILDD